ncbi:MAG: hypothetical protein ACRD50_05175 [Candidatus Acidiferrales bacterium]
MENWAGRILLALLTVGVAIGVYCLFEFLAPRYVAGSTVSTTPFTLKLETYSFVDNPGGELTSIETEARKSDGTTVMVSNIGGEIGLAAGHMGRKITFMDGRVVTLLDPIAAKESWPRLSTEAIAGMKERLLHPPSNCVLPNYTLVRYESVLGHPTAVIRPPGVPGEVWTWWEAPELGCQILRYQTQVKELDGSLRLKVDGRPVSLEIGEPDPTLFAIPENYREMAPSVANRLDAEQLGITVTDEMEKQFAHSDDAYYGRGRFAQPRIAQPK